MNTQALTHYIDNLQQATEAAARIFQWLDDNGETAPDDINWGHVGEAAHVAETLKSLVNFIDNRGD